MNIIFLVKTFFFQVCSSRDILIMELSLKDVFWVIENFSAANIYTSYLPWNYDTQLTNMGELVFKVLNN